MASTAAATTRMACTTAKAAMRAADSGTMCRAAAATAMTAAAPAAPAAAASGCKPYAWAEVSLFVEDVKSR